MKKFRLQHLSVYTICLILVLSLLPRITAFAADTSAEPPHRVVRTGFFAFDGYHMMDENGSRSGYGYEVLRLLSQYTDWQYEYVGYDQSWSSMLDMLRNGELDLLTSAQKTPEREQDFDFSARPIGSSATILSIKAGDERFIPGDYTTYEGMRVGLLTDNARNEDLAVFAARNGFHYTPVYFSTSQELAQALQEGTIIDAAVTSSLRSIKNEWILNQFTPEPIYAMVKKGNQPLLDELNNAIEQLDIYSPEWRTELYTKYYSLDKSNSIILSATEREYLKQLDAQQKIMQVAVNPDRAPYSYFDDNGQPQGILIELFAEAAKRAGIRYEILPVKNRAEYNTLIQSGNVDIDLGAYYNYALSEQTSFEITRPILDTFITQLCRRDFYGEPHRIAMPAGQLEKILKKTGIFEDREVMICASVQDCLDAVADGRSDAAYLFAYTAQTALQMDEKAQFKITSLPKTDIGFSLGINSHSDYRLLSILNKSVESLRDSNIPQQITLNYASRLPQQAFSIKRYIYAHPEAAAVLAGLLALLAAGIALNIQRSQAARRDRLRRQELERFVGYVCRANDIVLEVDMEKRKVWRYELTANGLLQRELPYDPPKYLQKIHPEDLPAIEPQLTEQAFHELIAKSRTSYFECRLKKADGSWHWYAHNCQSIPRSPLHPNSYILFRKDINEAKQEEERQRLILSDALENARHASEAKGNFLSRMSHEIRTPLNAIIGYLTLAQLPNTSAEKIRHCLSSSESASHHLLNIINDVLDISAIESGRFKIAKAPFNLRQHLTPLTAMFYSQARNKGVTFTSALHSVQKEWLIGDQLRVKQILTNLLSNAIKFTPAGGTVSLVLTQTKLSTENVLIKFVVSDTGIGMSKDYLTRIFTPFEQESAATAQKFGGTGLGLSITQNLTTLMHGSIEVTSQPGKGSAFTVSLPFQIAPKEPGATDERNLASSFSHVHALVVDDKPDECDYMLSLLKRCRVNTTAVTSGAAALEAIRTRENTPAAYDFCLLDWHMPQMDGIETARQIRQTCKRELPIIVVTAYDTNEIEDAARAAGVRQVIAKPLFPSTMFDLLISYFGHKNKTAAMQLPAAEKLANIRILLVEDNEMNREIAVALLQESGLIIDTAVDGRDALDKFTASDPGTYQCIFMDIQMPVMNGYEATRAIRSSAHPEAAAVPIIAVTADVFPEDIARALSCGMNDYISKPIDYPKLIKALLKFVRPEKKA